MSILTSHFLQVGNFQSMAFQLPELGLFSLAMMITMLTGGINLSIIASADLSGIVTALILTNYILPEVGSWYIILLAILAGIAISLAIGFLNGFIIAFLDVSPILATLGTMIFANGLSIVVTRGSVISGYPEVFLFIGNGLLLGISMSLIIFVLCAVIMSVILNKTPFGVSVYMLGSNPTATLFSGINVKSILLKTYLISGLLSGIASLIMISRFNSVAAGYASSYLLIVILISVLGGVSLYGGFGRVLGLAMALIILQIISSGFNLLGISSYLTIVTWATLLILVMGFNYLFTKYRSS